MKMMSRFILLLLPAVALARINIEIEGQMDDENRNMKVYFSGEQQDIVSDTERSAFKLEDSTLKDAIKAYFGARPDDAFLRSPTPWGDLYQSYGWRQVMRTLRPKSARVVKISSEPIIVMEQIFENNSTEPAIFNVGVLGQGQNTVSSTWSKDDDLTVSQNIRYDFDMEFLKTGGKTNMGYTASWGENYLKSETVTLGATSAMNLMLQPSQSVMATLQATKGSMQVEIEYEASLSGDVAVNYDAPYKGHHFWNLDVEKVMQAAGLRNMIVSKEVMDIGFYADPKVTVKDRAMEYMILDVQF